MVGVGWGGVGCVKVRGHVYIRQTPPQNDAQGQTPPNSIHGNSCQVETLQITGIFFPPDLVEKICHMSSEDFCNHALKLIGCCPHVLVKITLLCGKNPMEMKPVSTKTTNSCGCTRHSHQETLWNSGQTPPAEPIWCNIT